MTPVQAYAYAKEKFEGLLEKVGKHNQTLQSFLLVLTTYENKFNTLIDLLEAKDVIKRGEFEALYDHNTGWTITTDGIAKGNVVWVDYKLVNKETKEKIPEGFFEEKDFVIRMGTGSILFEESLLDKKMGDTFDFTYADKEKMTHTFTLTVKKVKKKIGEGKYADAGIEGTEGIAGEAEDGSTTSDATENQTPV